jgi:integrase/recombinase XerD
MAHPKPSWPLLRWRVTKTGKTAMVDCGMVNGKRVRFFYKTMEEAEGKAALMRVARQNEGGDAFGMLARTRIDAQQALKLLEPHGLTLCQAAQFYLDNIDVIQNAKTYSETVAELLHAKEQDGKSARYLQDMRNRLESAEPVFGARLLHTIKAGELDDYLRSLDVGGVTRNNFRRLFSVLFGYGVARRYCLKNPVAQIDVVTVERGKPPILSIPEARTLMAKLEPELVPAVALALFAGLRPEAEIFAADHPLDWRHIDLEDRTIDIDKSKNVGSYRYVKIQDNLFKWLKPHARKNGAICAVDYYARLRKARAEAVEALQKAGGQAAILDTWPADVLRHSYASYHCGHFKDARLTSQEMGHSGDLQIFNRHYRNRVKPAEALAFWEIYPAVAA